MFGKARNCKKSFRGSPIWRQASSFVAGFAIIWNFALTVSGAATGSFLQIRDGYFWDTAAADFFIPRGIAYQTWNPPVGANQTFAQLDYDLTEFKKMYANSVRCEFVWNEVERAPGQFDWSKPEHLVATAEKLGLRLFVLIGFQYAPQWFPTNEPNWRAINQDGLASVVLNYEHPGARMAYSNYVSRVAEHFKDRASIGGWILGNEYAYYDLWEPERRFPSRLPSVC